ncbi:SRPBCC family protein [Actinopolymorpha singaporensis]|uniref:Uncharacterized conserved protein YndB, AHSA1/START domain n=1 Tax=Actinopolymorpha singaporensis TaxID=117157 RepID=A0A1H1MG13_9ACTN|nr:SRPBCC domain-containing protein [Actinopolymorpha singaporensis]SDR85698.1 Uncharacterized conserved protein YndB, AHSA1/START domain [Actinopolymorpha singaporensis]
MTPTPHRVTGQTKDAGFQIGVSRTLRLPPDHLWRFLTSPRGLALWLGKGARVEPTRGAGYTTADGATGEVRGYHEGTRIRVTHRVPGAASATTRQVTVTPVANGAVLRFHEERLTDAAHRACRREHWQGVLAEVVRALGAE